MINSNPYKFIDPRLIKFPANKDISCPKPIAGVEQPVEELLTYFNNAANRTPPPIRWAYDNYFGNDLPFDARERRGDRVNIEHRFANIHKEELGKKVPSCTQSWYGHRVAKYDQRVLENVGHRNEMESLCCPNGWPYARRGSVGGRSETAVNQRNSEVVRPVL